MKALRAWVDGGSRGNPGPAGFGAHIEDHDGNTVREESGFLGRATNNVAEYNGLLAALRAAIELKTEALEVFADSELMVRQINGQYKVKNEGLKPLYQEAKTLAARLPRFRISHVRREENQKADRLANKAMDRER
jgi:ribonuclease HI